MRSRAFTYGLTLILVTMASSVRAEFFPGNVLLNSCFRVGYLYGSQVASTVADYGANYPEHSVQLDMSFGFPLVSGTIELSLANRLSVRLTADVGFLGQQNIIYGPWWNPASPAPIGLYSNARPGFAGFEALSQFDLWRSAGHRFGVIGGWRTEHWWYHAGDIEEGSVGSKYTIASSLPLGGLSAEMAYPGWRSSLEFMTSRFVSNNINGSVRQFQDSGDYRCAAQNGVLFECRIQGEANIRSNLCVGLYGRLSYQNVSGVFDILNRSMDVNVVGNTLTCELQMTYFF